jgi:hypothetical protein
MKWIRNILCLLIVLMFSAVELAAQATSSAAQVVTFGVRRIALQAKTTSSVANTNAQTPVKVTAGSESQVQSSFELGTTTSEQTFWSDEFAMNASANNLQTSTPAPRLSISNLGSPFRKSLPPGKLIVTYTE